MHNWGLDEATCDDVLILVEQNDSAHPRLITAFLNFMLILATQSKLQQNKASGKCEG
jgi:hypothetical protein